MRIATWNIGGGFIYSDQNDVFDVEKIEYFIDELKKIQPDIVCFQEIHVSQNNNQPKIIAEALGFGFFETETISDSHVKDGEKLSLSIISKYPILSSQFHKLPNPHLYFILNGEKVLSHNKGFLESKISYKNTVIRVLSGHWFPFRKFGRNLLDDEFQEIRERLESIISREPDVPWIIGADMNFEEIHILLPNIFQQEFKSVLNSNPTTPRNRSYDKIITSKEWLFHNSEIVFWKADHYLCFADVDLL